MFINQLSKKKILKPKTNNLNSTLFIFITVIVIVFIFGMYFWNFAYLGISNDNEVWAQFGDFIGGILNPFLAFFAFIALLFTIKLQSDALNISKEELVATRMELEKSRIAQEEQSESLNLQNEATKIQIFENTFFQLLNLFIENKKEIQYGDTDSNKAIAKYMNSFKGKYGSNYEIFYDKHESSFGTYFGQAYQVLNSVNKDGIKNKQRYVNIFRAQFTKDELQLLFYHCLGDIGKRKFKNLVEEYEFFEHIILNENIEKQLKKYNIKAFGNNEKLLTKYNDLTLFS